MPDVVTVILSNKNRKILILKRSQKVRTYNGLWGGIAGYVEKNETPYETAVKEISEETGLNINNLDFIKRIVPVEFTDFDKGIRYDWRIFPFLFRINKNGKINIDWEHSEYKWIKPSDIKKYETVPRFKEIVFDIC